MSGEPTITAIGNLTADPEVRFAASGRAVANFTVAVTPRIKSGETWEDGETLWMRCSVWGTQAEAIAETARKGDRVIVTGRLSQKSWQTKTDEKRTDLLIDCDGLGIVPRDAQSKAKSDKDNPWQTT